MQASKPHSPGPKKCSKSVAQRVMEVASSNVKSSCNNSLEDDQEVEDITNRAADLSLFEPQQADQNNNNNSRLVRHSTSSISASSLFEPETGNASTGAPSSVPTQQQANFKHLATGLVNSEPVFRQLVSSKSVSDQEDELRREGSVNSNKSDHISLETKVPLSTKIEFQQAEVEKSAEDRLEKNKEEEVSYYNDQVAPIAEQNNTSTGKLSRLELIKQKETKLSVLVPAEGNQRNLNLAVANNKFDCQDNNYGTTYDNPENAHLMATQTTSNGFLSTPNSPKAKSAPATPCNVTPTAFHQHKSHLNSILNPSPANTLPLDIRRNISNTCRVLPSSIEATNTTDSEQNFDQLKLNGEAALEAKEYKTAIQFFDRCINLAKSNHNFDYLKKNFKIYSHRAEAHFNLTNYKCAIEDSRAARDLNPKWTQAYYLQGQAQFRIGDYADCLAVFSYGLGQDPTNVRLFDALLKAALESRFIVEFKSKYNLLKTLDLNEKAFVVVAVLGQELLAKGHCQHATIILESALQISSASLDNNNKKFKSSILSTISFAYFTMKDYDKAVSYMQKELEVESELEDLNAKCRVLSNLGYTYYKMRKFDKSLESHRKQLNLAMRNHLFQQASVALNAIGHVHVARNDFTSALTSHTGCLELLKQLGDNDYNQHKELLSIGHINSMLGDYRAAEEKYIESIQLLKGSKKISAKELHTGLAMAYFNLAYLALKKQSFLEAKQYYESVIELAQRISTSSNTSSPTTTSSNEITPSQDSTKRALLFEMRAFNGMGHALRLLKDFDEAREKFNKQLELAEQLNDFSGHSQALCNLGMTYQHLKDYNNAWKLFDDNLRLVDKDPLLKAYGHSYIASMYVSMSKLIEARFHYESSLNLFKDLDYCSTERELIALDLASVNERINHLNTLTNITQQKQPKLMMS